MKLVALLICIASSVPAFAANYRCALVSYEGGHRVELASGNIAIPSADKLHLTGDEGFDLTASFGRFPTEAELHFYLVLSNNQTFATAKYSLDAVAPTTVLGISGRVIQGECSRF